MTKETKSESLQIVGFAKESRFSYYASPSSPLLAYQYTFIHDLFPNKTMTTLLPHYHYIAFSVPLLYAYSNSPYHFWYSYNWYIIYIYMYRAKHTALATSSLVHYIPLYNPWKSPYNFAVHNSIQKLWCLCLKILYPQTNSHQNRGRITNHQLPGFSPNFSEPLDSPNTHQSVYFSPYMFAIFTIFPFFWLQSGQTPNKRPIQTSVSHHDPILSWLATGRGPQPEFGETLRTHGASPHGRPSPPGAPGASEDGRGDGGMGRWEKCRKTRGKIVEIGGMASEFLGITCNFPINLDHLDPFRQINIHKCQLV